MRINQDPFHGYISLLLDREIAGEEKMDTTDEERKEKQLMQVEEAKTYYSPSHLTHVP